MLAVGGGLECSVSFSLAGFEATPVASTSKGSMGGVGWGAVVSWEVDCAATRRAGG